MMLRALGFPLAALLAGIAAPAARAQSDRFAPLVLQLPASTRALAMGDADVAGRDNDVIFYNPSRLGLTPGLGAAAERYRSASTLGVVSANAAFWTGGVGVGVQMLDYGAPAAGYPAPIGGLVTRGPLAASSLAATLGIAAQFFGIRWGVAGKYVEERLPSARARLGAADVGASADVGPVTVGLAAQNLGDDGAIGGSRVQLPRRVTAGLAGGGLPVGPFDLAVAAAVSVLRNGYVTPAAGIELGYTPLDGYTFAARVGARRTERGAQSPLTLGAGISVDRVALDYAYERFGGRGGAHRVGVRIR
jgi:hypothetical protein